MTAEASAQKKSMTVIGAAFLGVGGMVGAGIFALLGQAGQIAGSAVWLSFLLAGIVALFQGYSFAKLGSTFPSRGGTIEYLIQGFGNGHLTGITSWLFYFSGLVVNAMVAVSFGSYAAALLFGDDASNLSRKLLTVGVLAVMFSINFIGASLVTKTQTYIVCAVIALLGFFAVVTIADLNPDLLAPKDYPPVSDILASVALTFFAFLGFAIVAFTAGDMPNPRKNVPRAMYLALGVTTVIYVSIALGVFGTLPLDEVISQADTAIAAAAEPSLGQAGFTLMTLAACFSTSSAVNAQFYAASGITSFLSQTGQFPPLFGKKLGPNGNGGMALSLVLVIILAMSFDLTAIASLGSAVALIIFMLVSIAHLRVVEQTGAKAWVLYIAIGLVLLTLILFSIVTLSSQPETLSAFVVFLVGAIIADFVWKHVRDHSSHGSTGLNQETQAR